MENGSNIWKINLMLKESYYDMRNTGTIVNFSTCFDENPIVLNLYDPIAITGPECKHYHNIHILEMDLLARAAVLKYFQDPSESVLVLTNDFNSTQLTQNLYKTLKTYFSTVRNVVCIPRKLDNNDYEKQSREVKEYLENPEGILVTDIVDFNGAQANNIIIVINDYESSDYNIRNLIMRTMSFVIIIHYRDLKNSVPGLVRDDDLHEFHGNIEQILCNNSNDEHRINCSLTPFFFSNKNLEIGLHI